VKRLIDLSLGSVLFVVTLPLLVLVGALIRVTMGTPVLFRQVRPGRGGRPFRLVKFRTMRVAPPGSSMSDESRLTRVGWFVRRLSLDELPELWNVLRGDLSLVGPRPLLMEYLERYSPYQARRLEAKPGLTGLAQVSGRNALSWEEKFELDVYYVDHQSTWLDLRILAMTAWNVLRGHGVSAPGHVTMPEFLGGPDGSNGESAGPGAPLR
jgi:sugar transferase EpsL